MVLGNSYSLIRLTPGSANRNLTSPLVGSVLAATTPIWAQFVIKWSSAASAVMLRTLNEPACLRLPFQNSKKRSAAPAHKLAC